MELTGAAGSAVLPSVDVSGLDVPGIETVRPVGDGRVPLPSLVAFLASLDVTALPSDFDVLEVVAAWERVVAAATGQQLAAVAELAARPEVHGRDDDPQVVARRAARAAAGETTRTCLADEVAARLTESTWTSQRVCRSAVELPHRFPRAWAELQAGRISPHKASIVVDGCVRLDDDAARLVDSRVAARSASLTPSRVRQAVKRAVLRVDPATAAERRQRATDDRCVRFTPTDDGLAELWALLPAVDAAALDQALTAGARAAKAAGDERTLQQLRADALVGQVAARVELQVVVPASVLLGLSDDPADLVGHGPIDADLARTLAQDATWRRLLVDDDDHSLLSAGTRTYRPGAVLARHVQTRDRTCRFPGCDRPAHRCELDHTLPFGPPDAGTEPGNLGPLCTHHHQDKHAWHPDSEGATGPPGLVQHPPGQFTWTLPTGHRYTVGPPRLLEPDDPLGRLDAGVHAAETWPVPSLAEHALRHWHGGYSAGRRCRPHAAAWSHDVRPSRTGGDVPASRGIRSGP